MNREDVPNIGCRLILCEVMCLCIFAVNNKALKLNCFLFYVIICHGIDMNNYECNLTEGSNL